MVRMSFSKLDKCLILLLTVAALGLPLAMLGFRFDVWSWSISQALIMVTFFATVLLLLLALALLVIALIKHDPLKLYLPSVLVSAAFLGFMISRVTAAGDVPLIHDITTDLESPPPFVRAVALRGPASNPLDRSTENLAGLQREAYPQIQTILSPLSPTQALARAADIAGQMGWEIVNHDVSSGLLEAVARTRFFGFRDDVVVRVVADGTGGSRVDLRSVSRIGLSDMGENAARIMRFTEAF